MGLLTTTHGTEQDRPGSGTAVVADSAAYDMDSEQISRARDFVRGFLSDARTRHGVDVPARSMDIAQLVVSELATNVCKYAPGPCLLDLEVDGGLLGITMWDSGAVLPSALGADPSRAGQHGLEIVLAVCQSFQVRREPVGKRVRVQISLLEGRDAGPAGPTPW
ncbi:ATP-binding protein [Streptomyces sp. NPDC000971]|uniref:ATP-binding protein n=1 Tax=Streptomyces TaxID=1883 RepID=UPI0023B0211B|nr:ATP-binding protein [Streptomyces sp. KA12]MDF0373764.1 ATP-binding protein [Streptomyces sp. KA12]